MAKDISDIHTNRLRLRNIEADDAAEIVRWRSDPAVYCYFLSPHAITIEEHLNWFNKRYLFNDHRCDWMAVDENDNLVGVFGLSRDESAYETAEINYILAPEFKGCGFAREAIKALLNFAKDEWKCKFAVAEIHGNNTDSIKFASRLGMTIASQNGHFFVYKMQLGKREEQKTIYIRCDGNSSIGTGHVMRCLSIAEQVRRSGTGAIFITADEAISGLIKDSGFEVIVLGSVWNDLNQETSKLCSLIAEKGIKLLLVDSYFVTEEYLAELKRHTQVCYIDDLNAMKYPVSALINYNIYGEDEGYDTDWYEQLYLGPKYAPLRDEFMHCSQRSFSGVGKVLITSGGTDEYNVVGSVLKYLLPHEEFSNLEYYCVLGRFNKNIKRFKKEYEYCSNVHLLVNINNMSDYMRTCDVAISASGSTTYELCACGIPTIIYTLADNQIDGANTFAQKGIMAYAGDVRKDMDLCIANIEVEIHKLKDADYWNQQSAKMQTVVDGRGAVRLAKVLMNSIDMAIV